MPDESSPSEPPAESPEVRTIRQLVRLMQKFDLTAIDLGDGPTKIRLRRRGAPEAFAAFTPVPLAQAPAMAAAVPAPTGPAPVAETPAGAIIESPMVGTFYASSTPDSPAYVDVGSKVRPETTVCIIEAMKVFTDIPATIAGTIAEVLVKNGQPVEFGQPLFRLSPS